MQTHNFSNFDPYIVIYVSCYSIVRLSLTIEKVVIFAFDQSKIINYSGILVRNHAPYMCYVINPICFRNAARTPRTISNFQTL